jgi:hypothetical protein
MARAPLLLAAATLLWCAVAVKAEDRKDGLAYHPQIQRTLDQRSQIECEEVPLADLVAYLSDYHRLPINIDSKTLFKAGVRPDSTPFTLTLEGAPFSDVLRALLAEHKLSFMIDHGVLTVTTQTAAREWQAQNYGDAPAQPR